VFFASQAGRPGDFNWQGGYCRLVKQTAVLALGKLMDVISREQNER
jgi:hypothetical protein